MTDCNDTEESFQEKLNFISQLQQDIEEVRKINQTASIDEMKQFSTLQNSLEIHGEKNILILNLLNSMVSKAHDLNKRDQNPENSHIMNIYLDAFIKMCKFLMEEAESEENFREQNQQRVQHFTEIYETEMERFERKLENFKIKVDDKTQTNLKFISETREKLGDNEDEFEKKLQQMSDEFTQMNEETIEKYNNVILEMEKSVDEGNRDVASVENIWLKEVHKLAAQRLKVEQAYQMILRQFDTEIGGKADHLENLQNELSTSKKNHENWRNEVFEPIKVRHAEMILERKQILLEKMAARKIQKWWRKILKKRRRAAKRKARLEKQQKKANKFGSPLKK